MIDDSNPNSIATISIVQVLRAFDITITDTNDSGGNTSDINGPNSNAFDVNAHNIKRPNINTLDVKNLNMNV